MTLRRLPFYLGFGALLATNVATLVGLFMAPDIGRLLSGQDQSVIGAYEDRISQLRIEVDRLQSRHYVQTGDINLELQQLAQQQELLVEQHQYVKQLADKAAALGIAPATASPKGGDDDASPAIPAPVSDRPAPDEPMLTGSISTPTDAAGQIAAATANVDKMMGESELALAALSDVASSKADRILGTLAAVGIKPTAQGSDDDAEGGPLLPPVDGPESASLVDDANNVDAALARYQAARAAFDIAPVHLPVGASVPISSPFGNRKDPFTGRLAFHPGIDFAAPWGSTVLAAGDGTVSYVGQISGYGNAVEITHADGLVSLYGHLSAFLVKEGDTVSAGTPIARVGSTGRSTGPHLHFELRRGDDSVDPAPYLAAGKVLARIVTS